MNTRSTEWLAWALLLLLTLIWGASFYLMKEGLLAFSPVEMAAIRLSVAGICLSPFWLRYAARTTRREWLLLCIAGLFGNAIPAVLFGLAETVIPAAVAGILNSLSPVFIVILAFLIFRVRFESSRVLGVGLGLAGAILVILAGTEGKDLNASVLYSLLVVIATVCYAVNANLVKYRLSHLEPMHISSLVLGLMGLPYLVWLLAFSDFTAKLQSHPEAVWSLSHILVLGIMGTAVALLLFYRLLRLKDVVFASSVTYLMPIVSVVLGLVKGESLNWMHVLGMAIIGAGVYLTNRQPPKPAAPEAT